MFLSHKMLVKISWRWRNLFASGARAIELIAYVDDMLTGAEFGYSLLFTRRTNFYIKKRYSQAPYVILELWKCTQQNSERELKSVHSNFLTDDRQFKLLDWLGTIYVFQILVPNDLMETKVTKRESNIAKLFDKLGLMASVCVTAKIIMQNIWRSKV